MKPYNNKYIGYPSSNYELELDDLVVYVPTHEMKYHLHNYHPSIDSKFYPIWLMRYKGDLYYGVLAHGFAYIDVDEHNQYYDSPDRIVKESEVELVKECGELSWLSEDSYPCADDEPEEGFAEPV